MPSPAAISLADLPDAVLQRVLDLTRGADLFLLRQVCPGLRRAADWRLRRLLPRQLSPELGARFSNLQTLDLTQCDRADAAQHTVAVVAQLPGLQELFLRSLPSSGLDSSQWREALSRLTRLSLSGKAGGLVTMAAHCRSLQRLQLSFCELRWEDLRDAVAQLASTLTDLDLSDVAFMASAPPRCLAALNTGRLRTLRLSICQRKQPWLATPDIFAQLAAFTSLTCLDVESELGRRTQGMEQLNALTGLTSLGLWHTGAGHKGLATLTRLSRVVHFGYSESSTADYISGSDFAAAIGGFGSLTSFDLGFITGLNDFYGMEGALSTVTQLVFESCKFFWMPDEVAGLTQLRDLECYAEPKHVVHLSGLFDLTRLVLSIEDPEMSDDEHEDAHLRASHLRHLRKLHMLQEFRLGFYRSLEEAALTPLALLPELRALSLRASGLPAGSRLQALQHLPLQWLRLPQGFNLGQLPHALRLAAMRGDRQAWPSMAGHDLGGSIGTFAYDLYNYDL